MKKIIILYFRQLSGNQKFCIISNDCWGGEIYKILDRPFNSPFIGLTIMSPCYISLLENLKYNLSLPLHFTKQSKYAITQKLSTEFNSPIGVLGDTGIEIHFLHYATEQIANEKWRRRVQRIDWDNLYIKYDCGKDYADYNSVEKFLELPYINKLVFGTENFGDNRVYVTQRYSTDALQQFINCFLYFNPVGWLLGRPGFRNKFDRLICQFAFKYI